MKKFYETPSVYKIEFGTEDVISASVIVADEGDDNSVLTASWLS